MSGIDHKPLENIRLPVPLAWKSLAGARGDVTAVSTHALYLGGSFRGDENLPGLTIEVEAGPGQIISLTGLLVATGRGEGVFHPDLQSSADALRDLLGLIRKDQHIGICAGTDVEASDRFTGFSDYQFVPRALPEMNFDETDTRCTFLGRIFQAPILITGMTGGVSRGEMINHRLARAAAAFGIPMGIGSQRIALENPDHTNVFDVKKSAPDIFLIGNIGAAQLSTGDAAGLCRRAVDMVGADALAIHLNVMQECIQVEGDQNFRGLLDSIADVCAALPVPVMIKEVGCGIDLRTALLLQQAGVAAIDTGGRGGTSWTRIEGLRSSSAGTAGLGETFRDWGIPTAYNLIALRRELPGMPLVATGGLRDGQMVAKARALGADMAGIGLPLLRAALSSEEDVHTLLSNLIRGLKITMIGTGSRQLRDLEQHIARGMPLAPVAPPDHPITHPGSQPGLNLSRTVRKGTGRGP